MDLNLTRGEKVLLRARTHGKALAKPTLWLLAIAAAAVGLFKVVSMNPGGVLDSAAGETVRPYLGVGIFGVAVLIALIKFVVPFLKWRNTVYVVTNRKLCWRTGLLSHSGRDIPFYRINDVTYEVDFTDRIFGCGTLVVADATEKEGLKLHDVPHVQTFAARIQELSYEAHQRRRDDW